jgi:hypothetical protein
LPLPPGHPDWLANPKTRIRAARLRAAVAVNSELITLCSSIGRDILERQSDQGRGARIVSRLADDLRREFSGAAGFSRANLLYMRAFAEAWSNAQTVQPRWTIAVGPEHRAARRQGPRRPALVRPGRARTRLDPPVLSLQIEATPKRCRPRPSSPLPSCPIRSSTMNERPCRRIGRRRGTPAGRASGSDIPVVAAQARNGRR